MEEINLVLLMWYNEIWWRLGGAWDVFHIIIRDYCGQIGCVDELWHALGGRLNLWKRKVQDFDLIGGRVIRCIVLNEWVGTGKRSLNILIVAASEGMSRAIRL